jgi:tetratricopeptide (TPR) repeat protein
MRTEKTPERPPLTRALDMLNGGDIEGAADLCQRLLDQAPNDPALHQLAAAIALRLNNAETALRWASSSLGLRPDHPPTLLIAGHAARITGKIADALTYFKRARALAPQRAEAAFMICVILLERADGEARSALDDCLRHFPENAEWQLIGTALLKTGQQEAALAAFTRAARAAPTCALHMQRGTMLQSLGRLAEALEALRAAQALEPRNVEILLQLGLCLRRLGRHMQAREMLEQAIACDSSSARAWFALGLVAHDMKDWPAAIHSYQCALTNAPDLAEAAVNLGIARQESGDLEGARSAYRQAMRLRDDTFGRIAQALSTASHGELWLDLAALRSSLAQSECDEADRRAR